MYKKILGASLTKVDGKFYIIKDSEVYEVNETAARIFDLCDGKKEIGEIKDKVASFFGESVCDIGVDLDEFFQELLGLGLIQTTNL